MRSARKNYLTSRPNNRAMFKLEQFRIAADLYKHEDLLNWNKLYHLLYVTAGLAAVLGFILKNSQWIEKVLSGTVNHLAEIICFTGGGIAIGFFMSIASGLYYLHHRKRALRAINKDLKSRTKFSALSDQDMPWMLKNISLTTIVLILIPIGILMLWVSIFNLIKV